MRTCIVAVLLLLLGLFRTPAGMSSPTCPNRSLRGAKYMCNFHYGYAKTFEGRIYQLSDAKTPLDVYLMKAVSDQIPFEISAKFDEKGLVTFARVRIFLLGLSTRRPKGNFYQIDIPSEPSTHHPYVMEYLPSQRRDTTFTTTLLVSGEKVSYGRDGYYIYRRESGVTTLRVRFDGTTANGIDQDLWLQTDSQGGLDVTLPDCYEGPPPGSNTQDAFSGMCGTFFSPGRLAPDVKVIQQAQKVPPFSGYKDVQLQLGGFAPKELVAEGEPGGVRGGSVVEVGLAVFGVGAVMCCCGWAFAVWWKRRFWMPVGEPRVEVLP